MEMGGELQIQYRAFFPLWRLANSMDESLERDPSGLMQLQTEEKKEKFKT